MIHAPRLVQRPTGDPRPIILPSMPPETLGLPSGPQTPPTDPIPTPQYGRVDTSSREAPEFDSRTANILRVLAGAGAIGSLIAGPNSTFGAGAQGVGLGAAGALDRLGAQHSTQLQAYLEWMQAAEEQNAELAGKEAQDEYRARTKERDRILGKQDDIEQYERERTDKAPLESARLDKARADAELAQWKAKNPKASSRTGSETDPRAAIEAVREIDDQMPGLEQALAQAEAELARIPADDWVQRGLARERAEGIRSQLTALGKEKRTYISRVPLPMYQDYQQQRSSAQRIQQTAQRLGAQYSGRGPAGGVGPPSMYQAQPSSRFAGIAKDIERMVGAGELTVEEAEQVLIQMGL